jgi:hypothetical protein
VARAVLGGVAGLGTRVVLGGIVDEPTPPSPQPPEPATDLLVDTELTVRRRTRTGWTDEGDPSFTWADVVTGPALGMESRREVDPISGQIRISASATLLYSGPELENATTELVDGEGQHWSVTNVVQLPDRLKLRFYRVEAETTEETG